MAYGEENHYWGLCEGHMEVTSTDSVLSMSRVKSLDTSQYIVKLYHDGLITYQAKRKWKHIREKKKCIYNLWLPARGSLVITQNNHHYELSRDEYAITSADKPFSVVIQARKGELFEAYLVGVPAHQMQDYIPNCELIAGRKFSLADGNVKAAKQNLITLYEEGHNMSADVVNAYMQTSLMALSSPMENECRKAHKACNIRIVRLNLIRDVIESNLTNPELSVAMVAEECGISSRYVSYLLKEANLGFNELVWNRRLECAKKWLQDPSHEDMMISGIAYTCGFTSASHFSRSFKARFGCTPSKFRKPGVRLVSKAA